MKTALTKSNAPRLENCIAVSLNAELENLDFNLASLLPLEGRLDLGKKEVDLYLEQLEQPSAAELISGVADRAKQCEGVQILCDCITRSCACMVLLDLLRMDPELIPDSDPTGIARAAAGGDALAMERLFRMPGWIRRLRWIAYRHLARNGVEFDLPEHAREVSQETQARLLEKLKGGDWEGKRSFRRLAYGVAMNVAREHAREVRRGRAAPNAGSEVDSARRNRFNSSAASPSRRASRADEANHLIEAAKASFGELDVRAYLAVDLGKMTPTEASRVFLDVAKSQGYARIRAVRSFLREGFGPSNNNEAFNGG